MSQYIDGFVIPIAKDKVEDYRQLAERASKVFKEHGALDYWECVGDDFDAKEFVPFPQLAKAGPDETVIFSWIAFASREHRDEVNAKVMADPRMKEMMADEDNQPFDCKRMAYGGFKTLLHV